MPLLFRRGSSGHWAVRAYQRRLGGKQHRLPHLLACGAAARPDGSQQPRHGCSNLHLQRLLHLLVRGAAARPDGSQQSLRSISHPAIQTSAALGHRFHGRSSTMASAGGARPHPRRLTNRPPAHPRSPLLKIIPATRFNPGSRATQRGSYEMRMEAEAARQRGGGR